MKNLITIVLLALLNSMYINAKIVYTDLEPDVTKAANLNEPHSSYSLDINNDGYNDFYIAHFKIMQDDAYTEMGIFNYGFSEILADVNDRPKVINLAEIISPNQQKWLNPQTNSLIMREQWVGSGDKYIGLRIKVNNNWCYGWARINIPNDEHCFTLKDFAYENEANKSVNAGDNGSESSIDESNQSDSLVFYQNLMLNSISIKFYLRNTESVIVNLVDIQGKIIKELFSKECPGGSNNLSFVDLGLPIGTYFCFIKIDDHIQIKKIIIIN
jgi:hypothetical protein